MSVAAVYVSTKTIDIVVGQFKANSEGHWIKDLGNNSENL